MYSCSTGYYSFGHEIAHGLGANHDRGTANACNISTYPQYNYGYRDPSGAFRDIMSYQCVPTQCDHPASASPCTRVQQFSNTYALYNGQAIGNAMDDVTRTVNANTNVAANFYPSWTCQTDADCNDNIATTVDRCSTTLGICVFT